MVQSLLSSLHMKVLTDGLFWMEVNRSDGALMPGELVIMTKRSAPTMSSEVHSRFNTL